MSRPLAEADSVAKGTMDDTRLSPTSWAPGTICWRTPSSPLANSFDWGWIGGRLAFALVAKHLAAKLKVSRAP